MKCLCWSLGHAEQLLFSCLCSKVSFWNYVICHISHVTCHIAHVKCHIYVKCLCWSLGHAEQFLCSCLCSNVAVYGWKLQWFFYLLNLTRDSTNHRAGSQQKTRTHKISDRFFMALYFRHENYNFHNSMAMLPPTHPPSLLTATECYSPQWEQATKKQ